MGKVVFLIIFHVPPTDDILNDKGDLNQEPSNDESKDESNDESNEGEENIQEEEEKDPGMLCFLINWRIVKDNPWENILGGINKGVNTCSQISSFCNYSPSFHKLRLNPPKKQFLISSIF
jgi:hypothetical protein